MTRDSKRASWENEYVKDISSDKILLTAQELRDIIMKARTEGHINTALSKPEVSVEDIANTRYIVRTRNAGDAVELSIGSDAAQALKDKYEIVKKGDI